MHAKQKGFTLIELLLVIAIIGLIGSIIMVGGRNAKEKRRDVKRVSDAQELQKALALNLAKIQTYPTYNGCINGTDPVTTSLRTNGFIAPSAKLVDPLEPNNTATCYFYVGSGGSYTLRYTLETTSSAGTQGDHTVVP